MDTELMLDVGQANELKLAFRRAGWTNLDIKKLCEGEMSLQVLPVVRGYANVIPVKHIINCNAEPFVPNGWSVLEHQKGGEFEWDPTKIELYLSKSQKDGWVISGEKLFHELMGKPVLNANVLDYLLAHPELIPESWENQSPFFLGTIYGNSNGILSVRCLDFYNGKWGWATKCLNENWGGSYPAVVAHK